MKLSPRQEALNAILQECAEQTDATIDTHVWDQLVTIAWENRTHGGDRRDIQRKIRQVLLDAARNSEDANDATA